MKYMRWPARRRFLAMDEHCLVRVWTSQHPDAWALAQHRGWLTGEHPWAYMRDDDEIEAHPQNVRAYDWIRRMMAERMPGFSGDLPIWCWPHRPNPRSPSMRRSKPYIRVTAMVPRGRVLASDHAEWHTVLNGFPCLNEQEWEAWDKDGLWGEGVPDNIERTWQGVLDLQPRAEDGGWRGQPDNIQLCVDRIQLNEVVAVRKFPS